MKHEADMLDDLPIGHGWVNTHFRQRQFLIQGHNDATSDYYSMTKAERKAAMMGKRPGPRSAEDHAPNGLGEDGPEPVEPDAEGWISSTGNR